MSADNAARKAPRTTTLVLQVDVLQRERDRLRYELDEARQQVAVLTELEAIQDDLRKALTDEYPAVTVDVMPTVIWFGLLAMVFVAVMAFVTGVHYAGR